MPRRRDDENVEENLRDIDDRLKSIEKGSKSSSEEQLFFGITFSLLILFITLPMSDAIGFLQSFFPMSYDLASRSAVGTRMVGIVFALAASIFRYYGSMVGEHRCKRMRFFSLESALMGFDFFVLIVGLNSFLGIAIQTTWATIPVGYAVMGFVFVVFSFGEKRMLGFYASKQLIIRSDSSPIVSPLFAFINCGSYFALILGIVFVFVAPAYASTVQASSFVVITMGLYLLYIVKANRNRTRKSGKSRTGSHQSRLSRWL